MTERKKKRKNVKKREGEKVCIIFIEFIYWVHYIHASKRFDFYARLILAWNINDYQ